MSSKEILKKSIEKAISNGYVEDITNYELEGYQPHLYKNYYRVIFSHDFAKAFFKFGYFIHYDWDSERREAIDAEWKHHLMQMVLQEEPLEYLEKFL